MCLACAFSCCQIEEFERCGCEECWCSECWSDGWTFVSSNGFYDNENFCNFPLDCDCDSCNYADLMVAKKLTSLGWTNTEQFTDMILKGRNNLNN